MHKRAGTFSYSAADLVGILECAHRTLPDLLDPGTPLAKIPRHAHIELSFFVVLLDFVRVMFGTFRVAQNFSRQGAPQH